METTPAPPPQTGLVSEAWKIAGPYPEVLPDFI